jgi:putative endonuclease
MTPAVARPWLGAARRRHRGTMAERAGAAAEDAVARRYEERGRRVRARRLRGPWGEVDLVAEEGDALVFVEVKRAPSLAEAALRLGRRQMDRLCAAARAYCEAEPRGALTPIRFDLALVDGQGRIRVIQNAWGEDC